MNNENAVKNIQSRLDNHIETFTDMRKRDKSKAFRYKLITLFLTLTATLALGVDFEWSDKFSFLAKQLAFFATALVSFFTGIDLFYNHKGLWVQYTITRNELYKIKDDLNYYIEKTGVEEIDSETLDAFHARIKNTLDECNSWWVSERSKEGT